MFTIRFLIADSSRGLQTFIRDLFENFGFEPEFIKTANDPHAALAIAQELKPDFLLTDWFPKESLNGIALFKEIQKINPECQFAMLSTDVGAAHAEEARAAGAIFLQVKPCSAVELRATMGKALQQLSQENPKIVSHVNAAESAEERHQTVIAVTAQLPKFKPGDRVVYQGRPDSVKYVILRRGEMVVQLSGMAGLIPAASVVRA